MHLKDVLRPGKYSVVNMYLYENKTDNYII
jgi:hypothetical protein